MLRLLILYRLAAPGVTPLSLQITPPFLSGIVRTMLSSPKVAKTRVALWRLVTLPYQCVIASSIANLYSLALRNALSLSLSPLYQEFITS
ncbi:hypothetical protein M430DRAFT_32741, partial [Amorphotheca resinae ATCC 22711]